MKIAFLGDSITAGGLDYSYVNVLAKELNYQILNYGVGGTRIAKQKEPSLVAMYDLDFQLRVDKIDKDIDLLFVFGGTNDWGHGDAEIGDFDSNDPFTFYGAVKNLIEKILEFLPKDKVVFILPMHRYGEDNPYGEGNKKAPTLPLSSYVSIIEEIVQRYGISYIDFYTDEVPAPTTNAPSEWFVDGVHPNEKGNRYIADKIKNYLKEKGFI